MQHDGATQENTLRNANALLFFDKMSTTVQVMISTSMECFAHTTFETAW